MWLKEVKPASPFVAVVSFWSFILGLGFWFIAKINAWPDISQIVSFVIAMIGLAISVIMLLFIFPARLWERDRPLRELKKSQCRNRDKYIFISIRMVNASGIVDAGDNRLNVTVMFTSALMESLELVSLSGTLNIQSSDPKACGVSKPLEEKRLTIIPMGISSISAWQAELPDLLVKAIIGAHKEPFRVSIRLSGRDKQNNAHEWETDEWTTHLLTRVN